MIGRAVIASTTEKLKIALAAAFELWRRRDDPAVRRRLAAAWSWSGPLILAFALCWPVLLLRYRLDGGFAREILMVNGLRSAFNQALLDGHFPLWNEWVAAGKPFLIFGAYPLNFMTPLELLLGADVGQAVYKFELFVVAVLGAALFLWLGRALALRPVTAAMGFLSCYLMGQMPYQTGLVQSANIYLWAATSVVCALVYFATANRKLQALFLLSSLLAATGARPDAYPVFPVFMAGLVAARFVDQLWTEPAGWRGAVRDIGENLLVFAILPFAFYLWQVPLVLQLAQTANARVWASTATLNETVEYFVTALQVSPGGRIFAFWVLGAAATRLALLAIRNAAAIADRGALAIVFALVAAGSAIAVGREAADNFLYLFWPAERLCLIAIAAMLLGTAHEWFRQDQGAAVGFWRLLERQLSVRAGWAWPFALAGIHSAFIEDVPATGNPVEPSLVLKALFLFAVLYSVNLLSRPSGRLSSLVRYLALCAGLGWIFRDFASLPLFDIANVVWPTQRDMFWYVPTMGLMFAIGCELALDDFGSWAAKGATWLRALGALGGGLILAAATYDVCTFLYVGPSRQHASQAWWHLSRDEMASYAARWESRTELYRQAAKTCTDDARVIILPFAGLPGVGAGAGIRNAWGYDFVGDHYRKLAEAAFSRPLSDTPGKPGYPRLYHYNFMAGRIYHLYASRFPDLLKAQEIYDRFQELAVGPRLNGFFLKIMEVCGLRLQRPVDGLEPLETELQGYVGGKAYIFRPPRIPRRFAFLADGPGGGGEAAAALLSEDQATLERLHDSIVFEGAEASAAGIDIARMGAWPNGLNVRVRSDRPGTLVIFDAWDPGWEATVNGRPGGVDRAFVAMRAVHLDAGVSDVVLDYRPKWLWQGLIVSVAAMIFALWWAARAMRSANSGFARRSV